ncbi:MAG TPA: SPOR domain-containing protein [Firmicutes bacterium]|nr:SPOR domain-containing protein [Bacillota bacterium]
MPERRGRVGQSLSMVLMLIVMAALAIGLGILMGRYAFGLLASGPGSGEGQPRQAAGEVTPAGTSEDLASTSPSSPIASSPEAAAVGGGGPGEMVPTSAQSGESSSLPSSSGGETLYRVQVGEFQDRPGAEALARELAGAGYSGFVTPGVPFRVQVGAFQDKSNADRLAAELEAKGYSVVVVR